MRSIFESTHKLIHSDHIVYTHKVHTLWLKPFTSVCLHTKYVKHLYWITFQFCAFIITLSQARTPKICCLTWHNLAFLSLSDLFVTSRTQPIQGAKIIATFLFACSSILSNARTSNVESMCMPLNMLIATSLRAHNAMCE